MEGAISAKRAAEMYLFAIPGLLNTQKLLINRKSGAGVVAQLIDCFPSTSKPLGFGLYG